MTTNTHTHTHTQAHTHTRTRILYLSQSPRREGTRGSHGEVLVPSASLQGGFSAISWLLPTRQRAGRGAHTPLKKLPTRPPPLPLPYISAASLISALCTSSAASPKRYRAKNGSDLVTAERLKTPPAKRHNSARSGPFELMFGTAVISQRRPSRWPGRRTRVSKFDPSPTELQLCNPRLQLKRT